LREIFHGLRWIVRAGAAWRMMPHDLPPWPTVYQQSQRWLKAGVFDAEVVKLPETKKGLVLLPRRWGVERSHAWVARFRVWHGIMNEWPRRSPGCILWLSRS
jgi:transposase